MNYREAITYLYDHAPMFQRIGSTAYKEGLENTFAIDSYFGFRHKNYQTLHIAGTNGKGSSSHILFTVLKQSRYKVGLYTSPHLNNFRERIRIDGKMITENFIAEFMTMHHKKFDRIQPSFFELTTSMAFDYFAQEKVDIAVIETGLGGRLDCTNVIQPILSIITNISFDHMSILGNTLLSIAREKAGIIKAHTPVVIGEAQGEVRKVFEEVANDKQAPIVFAEDQQPILQSVLLPSGKWQFEARNYPQLMGQLGGFAQEKNAATVLCAIEVLQKIGLQIPPKAVYEGFATVVENSGLRGRWQVVQENPRIVLDTGHNVGGIEYIVRQLQSESYNRLHMIIGMVNDKDISGILGLLPQNAVYYFTKAAIPRALHETELSKKAADFNLNGTIHPTVKEAIIAAKTLADVQDFIFVGGSSFVVGDALDFFDI